MRTESTSTNQFNPNWTNIAFIVPMHILGLTLWPLYVFLGGGIQWQECVAFGFMYFLAVLGINVGYHRAFSHKSYTPSNFMKWMIVLGGASTAEGSALTWCSDHREHHKFQDTDLDPYNINRGFWWAHMGWILGSTSTKNYSNCPDLSKDKLLKHQDRYYGTWVVLTCFGLPLVIGFLLGRPLATFLLAGITRLFIYNQLTFLINSYAHYFGRRPYSTEVTARDSLVCAILAQGEGWHNYHHRFPWDYRNGHRFYHWDPSKWIIYVGQHLGLTSNLKRTPMTEIFRAQIQVQRNRIGSLNPRSQFLFEAMEAALSRWTVLTYEWKRFKESVEDKSSDQILRVRQSIQRARNDFKFHYSSWQRSLQITKGSRCPKS